MTDHNFSSGVERILRRFALWVIALTAICASGQVQNLQFLQATSTQAEISFDVPDPTNCLVQVSTDPNFGTFVNDTNAVLFPGSQNCNRASSAVSGNHVTFIAGTRTSGLGTDGLFHSLALAANQLYYYRIVSQGTNFATCDPNANCIQTRNPPFGNTFPEPAPFNASAPYNFAWPTVRPMLDRNTWFTDPTTGIQVSMLSEPMPFGGCVVSTTANCTTGLSNTAAINAFDVANSGNWSGTPSGATINSTNSTANTNALFIRSAPFCVLFYGLEPPGANYGCYYGQSGWGQTGGDDVYYASIDDVQTQITAACTGSTTSYQFALTLDGVNPATDWQTQACGSSAKATYPVTGVISGGSITTPGYPSTITGTSSNATTFGYWFANQATSRLTRPDMQPHTGQVTVDGSGNVTAVPNTYGNGQISIVSATAASPMVLTLGSTLPSWMVTGSAITIFNAGGTGCSGMNTQQTVTNVTGVAVTISFNGTGCTYSGYSGNVWTGGEMFRMTSMSVGSYITLYTPSPANYRITAVNSPASIVIASPPSANSYPYIYQQFGVLVRKATATTGNLTVTGVVFSDWESITNVMPLIGDIEVCAPYTVTDTNGIVLRLCMWFENFSHPIYAIEEVSGKSRYLGVAEPNGGCSTGNCTTGVSSHLNDWSNISNQSGGSLFTLTQNHWSNSGQAINYPGGSTLTFVDGAYNPAGGGSCPNNYQEITPANCSTWPYNNNTSYNNVTPTVGTDGADHTPLAQAAAYASAHPALPVFSPRQFQAVQSNGSPNDQGNGWIEAQVGSGQNNMSWHIKIDPSTYTIVSMFNDYSGYGCRFCGTHQSFSQGGIENIVTEANLAAGGSVAQGEYDLQTTTSTDNSTKNVCSGITDPNYTSYNGTSNCLTLTLSGQDPCWISGTGAAPMFGVCSWNRSYWHLIQSGSTPITVQVGDLLDDGPSGAGEVFRVVTVGTSSIQVIRRYQTPNNQASYITIFGVQSRAAVIAAHSQPWLLRELCSGGPAYSGGTIWMNLNSDPTGQAAIPDYPSEINAHADWWSGVSDMAGRVRTGFSSLLAQTAQPMSFLNNEQAPFNSFLGATTGSVQSHGSVSRDPASPTYEVDSNPLSSAGIASNRLWAQTANLITGSLWHIAAANVQGYVSGSWPALLKSTPYVMWSGGFNMQDISGPSSVIDGTSAHNWQFCIVWNANECVSSSTVGDVYANIPQSAHNGGANPGYCGPWDYSRSICGATIDQTAAGVNQFNLNGIPAYAQTGQALTIADGRTFRPLSKLFNRYNFQTVYDSAHGSYGGQWVFGHSDFYGSGLRNDLFVIKLPPLPAADQIARGKFVNLVVQAGPATDSGVNARLRFGYAENGSANAFYCAYNRKEACYTNPSPTSTSPYYFASDSGQTFVSCSNGCTMLLPAIPGRVVYYVVDRVDGSGNLIDTGQLQIAAVP